MLALVDWVGISLVITALAGAFTTVVTTLRLSHRVEAVHQEVRTMNETAMGELAAEDETRRIEKLPRPKRTAKEQRHLDDAPPADPPQGPGR